MIIEVFMNKIYDKNNNEKNSNSDIYKFETTEKVFKDFCIIQNEKFFKFGIDSILLSKMYLEEYFKKSSKAKEKEIVADFCSGTGIIGLYSFFNILDTLNNINSLPKFDFFEKQEYFYNLNSRNIEINNEVLNNVKKKENNFDFKLNLNLNLNNYLKVYNTNLLDVEFFKNNFKEKYSTILINPPYMTKGNGLATSNIEKDIAKIGESDFFEKIFETIFTCLKDKGELFLVSKIETLNSILFFAKKNKLELKLLQFISANPETKPILFLAKFVKNGKPFLKMLPQKYIN